MTSTPGLVALVAQKSCYLFDLDGTLVDSSDSHENAFLKAMADERPALAVDFSYERYKGQRTEDVFRSLGERDSELVKKLTEAKQRNYRREIEAGSVKLISGALELLEHLRRAERRIFLVTSASRISTDAILDNLHIREFFEGVVTGGDVVLAKPAPDCYLLCLEQAAITKDSAIVIEDALSGLQSAKSAGLDVIAVNNSHLCELPCYMGSLEHMLTILTALTTPTKTDDSKCESAP